MNPKPKAESRNLKQRKQLNLPNANAQASRGHLRPDMATRDPKVAILNIAGTLRRAALERDLQHRGSPLQDRLCQGIKPPFLPPLIWCGGRRDPATCGANQGSRQRGVALTQRSGLPQDPRDCWSGDTAPCKVTPVILHGVVSPELANCIRPM